MVSEIDKKHNICHFSFVTNGYMTRRQLTTRAAYTDDPQEVRQIARQVQHWTNSGLLTVVGEKNVGRGKARLYPPDALYLVAILMWLATQGESTIFMARVLSELDWIGEIKEAAQAKLLDAAKGRRQLFVLLEDFNPDKFMASVENWEPGRRPDFGGRCLVRSVGGKLPKGWNGGRWLDLTAILKRTRTA